MPLETATRRRTRMLRSPRCASDRWYKLQSRSVVPGLHLLQAAPYTKKAKPRRLSIL